MRKAIIFGFFLGTPLAEAFFSAGPTLFSRWSTPGIAAEIGSIGLDEWVVTDPLTGLALFGYDPVVYFIKHKAQPGAPEFETILHGRAWRFVNPGNRSAFESNPELYVPQFGGYDAVLLADDKLSAGDPQFFAVVDGKLLLFRSEKNRDLYVSDRKRLASATQNWLRLRRDLGKTDR